MTETREQRRIRDNQRRERARNHNLFRKLQAGSCSCGRCGRVVTKENARDFHWDHLDPSTKTVGVAILVKNGASIERIDQEIALCQLLHIDCHIERTRSQRIGGSSFNMPAMFRPPTLFGTHDGDVNSMTVVEAYPNTMPVCVEDGFIVMRLPDGNAISCIRINDKRYFARTRDDRWIEAPLWSVERANGMPTPLETFHLTH